MRALGVEPNLFPLKRRVPCQVGVTRVVGREGIEPPVSEDCWFTASVAAMARPTHVPEPRGGGSGKTMPL